MASVTNDTIKFAGGEVVGFPSSPEAISSLLGKFISPLFEGMIVSKDRININASSADPINATAFISTLVVLNDNFDANIALQTPGVGRTFHFSVVKSGSKTVVLDPGAGNTILFGSGSAAQKLTLTAATAETGDFVMLSGASGTTWNVVAMHGAWTIA